MMWKRMMRSKKRMGVLSKHLHAQRRGGCYHAASCCNGGVCRLCVCLCVFMCVCVCSCVYMCVLDTF